MDQTLPPEPLAQPFQSQRRVEAFKVLDSAAPQTRSAIEAWALTLTNQSSVQRSGYGDQEDLLVLIKDYTNLTDRCSEFLARFGDWVVRIEQEFPPETLL